MTNASALLQRLQDGRTVQQDIYKLKSIKASQSTLKVYIEDLSPALRELTEKADYYLSQAMFCPFKMRDFELQPGVYSLTDYAPTLATSVKALASTARQFGFKVEIDRKRLYDKSKYHTVLIFDQQNVIIDKRGIAWHVNDRGEGYLGNKKLTLRVLSDKKVKIHAPNDRVYTEDIEKAFDEVVWSKL